MRHARCWFPLLASAVTALACSESLTGPESVSNDDAATAARATREGVAASQLSFQNLAPGDAVIVSIEATGCFNHDTYEFKINVATDGTNTLSGARTEHLPYWADDTPDMLRFDRRMVTTAQTAGLDRMLAYYRAGPPNTCTSSHTISLRHMRADALLQEESYTDGSCGMDEAKDIVSFFDLVRDDVMKDFKARRQRIDAAHSEMRAASEQR